MVAMRTRQLGGCARVLWGEENSSRFATHSLALVKKKKIMRAVTNDVRYWMIQRIIETRSDDLLQRIMNILIEDTVEEDPFKSLNGTQLELVSGELDLADEDIAAGRVHSQESIAAWIENLD